MNSKRKDGKTYKVTFAFIISFTFFFRIVNIEYLNSPIYTLAEYIFLLLAMAYTISHIKIIKREEYKVLILVAMMGSSIFVSSCINKVETFYIRAALYYDVYLVTLYGFILILSHKEKLKIFFRAGRLYLTIVLLINDLLMLCLPDKFYNIHDREIGTCFLGNKFSVAYAHIMFIFIDCYLEENKYLRKIKLIVYSIIMTVLCIHIECNTALLAVWLFTILYHIKTNIRKILSKAGIFISAYGVAAILLVFFSGILSLGPIRYFIENILHRDATLTGRLEVYPFIFKLIPSHKWFGYGYGTMIVKETSIWWANVQNAFWDFIIRYGIIAMALLVFLIILIMKKQQKEYRINARYQQYIWACIGILYTYVFMGIGEIVYDIQFLLYIALLNAVCYEGKSIRLRGAIYE